MKTKAQELADEAISTMNEIKESLDRLIELFENLPEGEPPGFGDVL